ncbi:unnamed protein product [Rotaria magnacalcarata]|uniref:Uncharacterized protein n=1 Tax=Rotaria magnacalcarata TaxID=392030 RepID=A0A816VE61_9BILA|nr:unnamed protein product [Rotaria magnacalcarata]
MPFRDHWRDFKTLHNDEIPIDTTSNETAKLFDATLTRYVGYSRILAAALGMFSIPRPTALAHAQIVKTLGDATTSSNRYIKLHTQALIDESLNYRSRTTDTWEAILLSYPFDIMTLKFPLDTYFHIGDRNMLRDSVTRVLPIWESSSSTKIEGLPGLIFLRFIRSFKNSGIFFPRGITWKNALINHINLYISLCKLSSDRFYQTDLF